MALDVMARFWPLRLRSLYVQTSAPVNAFQSVSKAGCKRPWACLAITSEATYSQTSAPVNALQSPNHPNKHAFKTRSCLKPYPSSQNKKCPNTSTRVETIYFMINDQLAVSLFKYNSHAGKRPRLIKLKSCQ